VLALAVTVPVACGGLGEEESTVGLDSRELTIGKDGSPVVKIDSGKLKGKLVGQTAEFLGIPYAKPPVGELRFMPPEPVAAWQGTRDASAFGLGCSQDSILIGPIPHAEDCLTINVFTPRDAKKSDELPVMVFIHGGAFVGGASLQYDGQSLSEAGHLVLVSMNYRLGPLGFLSLPALDAIRPASAPSGNDGIRDQQLALDWVRRNIRAFGGDPGNVTVAGESAGSVSACLHMVSPTGQNRAQRFIMESGVCIGGIGTLFDKAGANALGVALAEAFCPGASDVVACLRSQSADELEAWGKERGLAGAGWAPCYDANDPLLPAHPYQLIAQGQYNHRPIVVGTNKSEFGLFQAITGTIQTAAQFAAVVDAQFGPIAPWVKAQYAVTSDAEANPVFIRLMTDVLFRCPTRTFVRAAAAQGSTVYLYSFEEGMAFHAFELSYVFGPQFNFEPTYVASTLTTMQRYWSHFAAKGDPNACHLPRWPVYDTAGEQYMILKTPFQASSGLAKADCDFWDALAGP
jgi:para-nitrobenzyl esterase